MASRDIALILTVVFGFTGICYVPVGASLTEVNMQLVSICMLNYVSLPQRYGHCKFAREPDYTPHRHLSRLAWKRPQLEREIVYCNSMATESHGAGKLNCRNIIFH